MQANWGITMYLNINGSYSAATRALLMLCVFAAACAISQAAYADTGTVTATSYQGNWLVYENSSDVNTSGCPVTTLESSLKNCIDGAAAAQNIAVATPWWTQDAYNNACSAEGDAAIDQIIECSEEVFGESSGSFPLYIGMACPNDGSPNPFLGPYTDPAGNQKAGPIPGWCVILSIAPPPASNVCPNGLPIPDGQNTCASPAVQTAGEPAQCQCGGDPINIGTGNMYYSAVDFKDGSQFPLEFKRVYNSSVALESSTTNGYDASMGFGWTSNLSGAHIYTNITQQFYTCTDSETGFQYMCPDATFPVLAVIWHDDGSEETFQGSYPNIGTPAAGTPLTSNLPTKGQLYFDVNGGYRYLRGDGYTEFYDSSGKLTAIQNQHGSQHGFSYDSSGRVSTVTNYAVYNTNASPTVLVQFTYDALNRIQTMTNPAGGIYTYNYDAAGNLVSVVYPDNTSVQYLYEDARFPHAMTGVIDEDGNRYATWTYDSQGRANSSQNAGGANSTSITYNVDGSADVTEPTGLVRHLIFTVIDGKSLLTSTSAPCTECDDKSAAISYDASGFVSSKTDFEGNVTQYTHDNLGHELTRKEGVGTLDQRTTTTQWNALAQLPQAVATSGAAGGPLRVISYCYNSNNGVCSDSAAIGGTWTTTVSDPGTGNSRTKTYFYSTAVSFNDAAYGVITAITDPVIGNQSYLVAFDPVRVAGVTSGIPFMGDSLGRDYDFGYDANVMLIGFYDESTLLRGSYTYDGRQRLTSATLVSHDVGNPTEVTQYSYDAAGDLTRIIYPTGKYLQFGYDGARRLTSTSDNTGESTRYTLDSSGNRILEQRLDPVGVVTYSITRTYDTYNHVVKEVEANGQTTLYTPDLLGNVASIQDPKGNLTSRSYDSLNRLESITDPAGTTTIARDALDHILDVTDPRMLITNYVYDAFGDVVEQDAPDTGTTLYSYDAVGDITSRQDARGQTTTYAYDVGHRLSQITYPDSTSTVFTYLSAQGCQPSCPGDGVGRLAGINRGSGSAGTGYRYDGFGNIAALYTEAPNVLFQSQYAYDLDNNVTQIGFLETGSTTASQYILYQRDAVDRVTEVDAKYLSGSTWKQYALAKNIVYEPFGAMTGLTYGNGLLESRTYDQSDRLTNISIPGVMGLTYGYDPDDNVTSVLDSVSAGGKSLAQTLTYDAMNRLTAWSGRYANITSLAFGYDVDGNRTFKTANTNFTGNYNYAAGSNRLMSITGNSGAATYAYDNAGNVTNDGTYKYTYDSLNAMTKATTETSTTVGAYVNDGMGRRAQETANGTTHSYVYDEAGHLQAELNASGTIYEAYVWLGGRPIAVFANSIGATSTARYIHADNLNTPRVMTDSTKAVGWAWQSDPFGNGAATAINFGSGVMIRLPGQYYDTETGTHYNYFRHYDPSTGRYMESDPIGLAGGINTYAYVNDNSLRFIDPLGLCSQKPQPSTPNPDSDQFSVNDCIKRYLDNKYGNAKLNFVEDNSFIGPNGTENMNDAARDEARNKAIEAGANYFFDVDLGPFGWGALVIDAARAIKASGLYLEARNACY